MKTGETLTSKYSRVNSTRVVKCGRGNGTFRLLSTKAKSTEDVYVSNAMHISQAPLCAITKSSGCLSRSCSIMFWSNEIGSSKRKTWLLKGVLENNIEYVLCALVGPCRIGRVRSRLYSGFMFIHILALANDVVCSFFV